ncbi:tannase and feruloyl esterase [Penicillium longicatenatum]|nr:tannase and feruloyl esterase [Penicillium longicatenatum]
MAATDSGLSRSVASAGRRHAFATFAWKSGHHEPYHGSGWEMLNGLIDWRCHALHMSMLTIKAIVKS